MPDLCKPVAGFVSAVIFLLAAANGMAADSSGPEEVLRTLVKANVEKDLATLSRLMAHDEDSISYTIEGRKYVGWPDFARDMQTEFESATRIEIRVTQLKVWTRAETAWFAMEMDYIRYVGDGKDQARMVLPLRETGVLERRDGRWILVNFHESFGGEIALGPGASPAFPPLQ
ncbi:MAG: nuclear transport factor 2 family protein [Nitrospirota bacterium]